MTPPTFSDNNGNRLVRAQHGTVVVLIEAQLGVRHRLLRHHAVRTQQSRSLLTCRNVGTPHGHSRGYGPGSWSLHVGCNGHVNCNSTAETIESYLFRRLWSCDSGNHGCQVLPMPLRCLAQIQRLASIERRGVDFDLCAERFGRCRPFGAGAGAGKASPMSVCPFICDTDVSAVGRVTTARS
jgi:hypothetical protein